MLYKIEVSARVQVNPQETHIAPLKTMWSLGPVLLKMQKLMRFRNSTLILRKMSLNQLMYMVMKDRSSLVTRKPRLNRLVD